MTIDLTDGWRLHEAPLGWDWTKAADVAAMAEGWMDVSLPCDVHMPLIASGRMRDPVIAGYCHECEWVEQRSWWFLREIDSSEIPDCSAAVLELDSLDACADVFFNGERIGSQPSAFYPFSTDILLRVRGGANELLVRVTSGLERVEDGAPAEVGWNVGVEGERRPDRGDMRRVFIRKPQYVYGWDWGPRVASVGIVKGARIECKARVAVKEAHVRTVGLDGGRALLRASVTAESLPKLATARGSVKVELYYGGAPAASAEKRGLLLNPGHNYVDLDLELPGARLWWPNGMGGRPLYEARVSVESEGVRAEYPAFRVGVRTVALDTSPAPDGGSLFRFVVNGVPAMMKGGNWIPADSVYARVTDAKYGALVREAQRANFTMLRVWGGGIYERDAFYDACDECGILLWHDFMFACAAYPDHRDAFMREVERELDYQTKRLRNHACMGLWSGNNENQWLIAGAMARPGASLGLKIYDETAPEAVRRNCPEIPYWPSSPFGGREPNGGDAGDSHIWPDFMMHEDMARRITPEGYDGVRAAFVSEYGYPGPTVLETVAEYFDGMPIDRAGAVWDLHTNTFEKNTVAAGIEKHYTDRRLDLDGYLLCASLVQALMLGYSLEALRLKPGCWGALFWMYDDCWGEVGWTVIDYALRRKPSWYAVRRAFAPVLLAVRREGGDAAVYGCNDTADDMQVEADAGWFPLDGSSPRLARVSLALPARGKGAVLRLPLGQGDPAREVWAVRPIGAGMLPATLRLRAFREMDIPEPRVQITRAEDSGGDLIVTVRAEAFAHAVHFGPGYLKSSDAYFDLLPGESRAVRIEGMAGKADEIRAEGVAHP